MAKLAAEIGPLDAAKSLRDRALLVAMYETGGRISEVLALNVEDLTRHENGGKPWYECWFRQVKVDGEQHYGYIREQAAVVMVDAWLAAYPARVTMRPRPLFPSFATNVYGARLTAVGWSDVLKAIAARAGITKNVHPHLFRHTRASHLLREDRPEHVVKDMMGWSRGSRQLLRYNHLTSKDTRRSLGLIGAEEGKPAELLVPRHDVPAMVETPLRPFDERAAEQLLLKMVKEGKLTVTTHVVAETETGRKISEWRVPSKVTKG